MQITNPAIDDLEDLPPEADADAFVDELKAGTRLLNGQYTIISFLNSGGFGITYLAKDSLDRTVVIKECFPNSLCRRSESIVRARSRAHQGEFRSVVRLFVQEARSLSKLVHPNIVGVHQVFEDNDTAYMAIDYINGKDLLEILDSTDQAFTPAEIVEMLKKTLGAVEFIHQAGILHRDISPDNILIDPQQNPILIDFGAAREQVSKASRVLSARRVVKDGYSPQEFYLAGSAQGPYSDLYALAATFYHVITGEAPPESQRRLASIAEGTPDPYKPLAGRFPGYPPGFLETIDKAAMVLPKDRITTAAAWMELIEQGKAPPVVRTGSALRNSTRIVTDMISPVTATRSGGSRLPVLLGTSVLAALAVGLGVWLQPGGDTDLAAPVATEAPTLRTATVTPSAPPPIAEAEAAAQAREDARLAAEAEAEAMAQENARLAAEAEAEAMAREDARLAAEAEAAAQAREDARLAAEAEAAAAVQASEDARLAAEAEAAVQAREDARLAAEAEAAANAEDAARLAAEAAAAAETEAALAAQEARAAALAAVTPRPALADTPVLDDQFADIRWDYDLPFRTEVRQVDGETFPVISSVIASALSGTPDDAWIAPGTTIYAVNGEWVTNGAAIEDLIRISSSPDEYGLISASVRIRASDDGLFQQVTLVAPATRWTSLKNGVLVRTESANGNWLSVVDTITYSDQNGLLPGDVILSEANLGRPVDSAEAFEVIMDLLAFKAVAEASFEILRKDEKMTVRMPLARQ